MPHAIRLTVLVLASCLALSCGPTAAGACPLAQCPALARAGHTTIAALCLAARATAGAIRRAEHARATQDRGPAPGRR
jgi:hypothetical protein